MTLSRKVVFALPSILVAAGALIAYLCTGDEAEPMPTSAMPDTALQESADVLSTDQADADKNATAAAVGENQSAAVKDRGDKVSESMQPKVQLKTPEEYRKYFAETAAGLGANAFWKKLVAEPGILPVLVKTVEQVACGNRPLALGDLRCMPLPVPFEAVASGDGFIMAPATEKRYSEVVDALVSVQMDRLIQLLAVMEPELDRILHKEFGYPESTQFRIMLTEALKVVLTTPVPDKPLPLVEVAPHLYKFDIEELEKLSDAQKFMLRLGIDNQQKVNAVAKALWPWSAAAK